MPRATIPGRSLHTAGAPKEPGEQQSGRQGDSSRARLSPKAGTDTPASDRTGRAHSPAQGPTRLVYAHPASAPPRGAQSRCGPAAAAEWGARGASAAPERAELGLRNPSPALRPAWPGQSLPPLSTARPRRSSPVLLPAAQTGCAGRQQGKPQSWRRRAVPARSARATV